MSYFLESTDTKIKEKIVELHGKTVEDFDKDVEDLKIWLKTRPHLPQEVMTHRKFEMFFIINKCNGDKARSKIEVYFRMRARFPEIFLHSHPEDERVKQAQTFLTFVPVPKLCSNLDRIIMMKIKPTADSFALDPTACAAHMLNVIDVRFLEDMCNGHAIIFDLEHVKIGHAMKLTPMFIRTMYIIGDKALTTHVSGIHLINAPKFLDQTIFLVKSMVKPKLAERIMVHKDIESALKTLDKDCIPKDYGGNEKPLEELEALFQKKIDEHKEYFDQRDEWKIDEDLLPEKFDDDSYFGYYGNFKQLQVD